LLEMGGWGDSATRQEQKRRQREAQQSAMNATGAGDAREGLEHEGDVYMNDEEDAAGVWDVEHVLDASFDKTSLAEAHTLSIEVQYLHLDMCLCVHVLQMQLSFECSVLYCKISPATNYIS
jgi:hypothetical protein